VISRAAETGGSISSIVGKGQEVLSKLLGSPNIALNKERAQELVDSLISKAGGNSPIKVGSSTFANQMRNLSLKIQGGYQKVVTNSLKEADQIVRKSVKSLKDSYPMGDWNYEQLGPIIREHKRKFSDEMTKKAAFLNQKNAQAPSISTYAMKEQLNRWKKEFPEGGAWMSPEMKQYFSEASNMGDKISFQQLQNLRSMFSGAAHDDGLLKAVGQFRAGQMKTTMDNMMDRAIKRNDIPESLRNKLLSFNSKYTEGMAKYDDSLILKMAKQGKDRMPLNQVTGRLLEMDYVTAGKLKTLLPKGDWKKMGVNMWDDMVAGAKDPATSEINPTKILANIKQLKMNGTYPLLFEGKKAIKVESILKELESRGWQGNLDELLKRDTDVSSVLQGAIAQQKELDEFMSQNFTKILNSRNPEKAIEYATHNPIQAREMMDFLDGNDVMVDKARKIFISKLLSKVVTTKSGAISSTLDGEALATGVRKFDEIAGGVKSNNPGRIILGDEMWDDLTKLGEDFKTTSVQSGGGTGMAAAQKGSKFVMNILTKPLETLKEAAKQRIMNNLFANPEFVRYMSVGLKQGIGGKFGNNSRTTLGAMFRGVSQAIVGALRQEGIQVPYEEPSYELKDSEVWNDVMGAK